MTPLSQHRIASYLRMQSRTPKGPHNLVLLTSWSLSLPPSQPASIPPWPPGCPPSCTEDPSSWLSSCPPEHQKPPPSCCICFSCHLATPHLATHTTMTSCPAVQRNCSEGLPWSVLQCTPTICAPLFCCAPLCHYLFMK